MIYALILITGFSNPVATRIGTYSDLNECNRRVLELHRNPRVSDAFCLPIDQ